MSRLLARFHRAQRGVTMAELLVALAIFALFMLMIDAVFSGARTSSRKTEIAADVQQNVRVGVDRMTRELRETRAADMVIDTSQGAGRHGVVFKSARLAGALTVFCLYTRTSNEPFYNPSCFDNFPGSSNDVPKPSATAPYTYPSAPPYPLCAPNTDTNKLDPCGSYQPIWQQYVGYYVEALPDGSLQLRRVNCQLDSPLQTLSASLLTSCTNNFVIATLIESFEAQVSGGVVSVTLKGKGSEMVQGRAIPDQRIDLSGKSWTRD